VVDGQALIFEVFGLKDAVLIMIDRETGSIWTHLDGKAIQGPLEGKRMNIVPLPQMTWANWEESRPDTLVLSPDTPFANRYRSVQIARYNQREAGFGDDRLASNALVIGVEVDGAFKGYPVEQVGSVGVVNDTLSGLPILIVYDTAARSGLAFSRVVDGQVLDFYNSADDGLEIRDRATNSIWEIQGLATDGSLTGMRLDFVSSFISEWYGWSGYHPETDIYEPGS
jgi:hypothetical protein